MLQSPGSSIRRKQHLVWVLPPGIHGKGPWDFDVGREASRRGEVRDHHSAARGDRAGGTRPEYPAGYEIVRLTDDGRWAQRTAEIDKVIQDLIAQHGRGHGDAGDDAAISTSRSIRRTGKHYCVEHKPADVRFYLEEDWRRT